MQPTHLTHSNANQTLTFGSVYRTDNVQVITEFGRLEHLQIAQQTDVMYLFQ